mmetsp:Transcript_82033/g.220287  ORF Transcript_82033/g.220287 Transcript_82033/m.220287 type:complete len:86 (-) Transcript_82033:458-715(-)
MGVVCGKQTEVVFTIPNTLKKDIATTTAILNASAAGDVSALENIMQTNPSGFDANAKDYDGRTALHLACSEGHMAVVRLLVEQVR